MGAKERGASEIYAIDINPGKEAVGEALLFCSASWCCFVACAAAL